MNENSVQNVTSKTPPVTQEKIDLNEFELISYKASNELIIALSTDIVDKNIFVQFVKDCYIVEGTEENIAKFCKKMNQEHKGTPNQNLISYFVIHKNYESVFSELSNKTRPTSLEPLSIDNIQKISRSFKELYKSFYTMYKSNSDVSKNENNNNVTPFAPKPTASSLPSNSNNTAPLLVSAVPQSRPNATNSLSQQKRSPAPPNKVTDPSSITIQLINEITSSVKLEQIKHHIDQLRSTLPDKYKELLNATYKYTGRTALHTAVRNGRNDVVKLLLDNGAVQYIAVATRTLPNGITFTTKDVGWYPIHIAIEKGYPEVVRALINHPSFGKLEDYSSTHKEIDICQFASTYGNEEIKAILSSKFPDFFKKTVNQNNQNRLSVETVDLTATSIGQSGASSNNKGPVKKRKSENNNGLGVLAKTVRLTPSLEESSSGSDTEKLDDTDSSTQMTLACKKNTYKILSTRINLLSQESDAIDEALKEYEHESEQEIKVMKLKIQQIREHSQINRQRLDQINQRVLKTSQAIETADIVIDNIEKDMQSWGSLISSQTSPTVFKGSVTASNINTSPVIVPASLAYEGSDIQSGSNNPGRVFLGL